MKTKTSLTFSLLLLTVLLYGCDPGNIYQAGSGVGSLVDIGNEKYKSDYVQKYSDSFFILYPQYRPTNKDLVNPIISDSSVFKPTNFHFSQNPNETYCVQWSGTGFISIRFAYNYDKNESVIENTRINSPISDSEKLRIEKRFRTEILNRIDSIISKSKDSSIAIWQPPT